MTKTMKQLTCGGCGKEGKSTRTTRAGTPALPYRWVREGDKLTCPDCKPRKGLTRHYSYDCKPPTGESLRLIDGQMRLAHKYHNALVASERERRRRVEEILWGNWPILVITNQTVAQLEVELETARDAIRAHNTRTGTKTQGTREQQKEVKRLKDNLKTAREERKRLRAEAFADPYTQRCLQTVEDWHKAESKRLYNEEFAGLYWGSKLHVMAKAGGMRSGAPPDFVRFRGDGHITVQCQGGAATEDVMNGRCSQVDVESFSNHWKKPHAQLLIRVGSEGTTPIFANLKFRLHRPFPEGSRVKWVHLIRRKEGVHARWRIIFALDQVPPRTDHARSGTVGIDVGWRMLETGELRACYWTGSNGLHGQLRLGEDYVRRCLKADEIQAVRKALFNNALARLLEWVREHPLPTEWTERTEENPHPPAGGLAQWKSEERLRRFIEFWRDNRLPNDQEILYGPWESWPPTEPTRHAAIKRLAQQGVLEAWRLHDRHLCEYMTGLRRWARNYRDNLYRNFARRLAKAYRGARVENINWREEILKKPKAEHDDQNESLRMYHRLAAPGRLVQIITEAFATTERVNPDLTTTRCFACSGVCEFDKAKELEHTCEHCGVRWDQDENASIWLLRGGAV